MIKSKYNMYLKESNKNYIYNSLSNSFIQVDQSIIDSIENSEINLLKENEIDLLKEMKIITNKEDEIDTINTLKLNNLLHRFNDNVINLTIAPTSSCNFNCTYCYEEERPNVFMNNTTEKNIIKFIESHSNVKIVHITWFGGEPLLNFKQIKELTLLIKAKGYKLTNSIITNGYLINNEIISWFINNNFGMLQITLDGLEQTHNKRRPHINGGNSYKKILQNLDKLFSSELKAKIVVRINIDSNNEKEYPILAEYLTNKYKDDRLVLSPSFVSDIDNYTCRNSCNFVREDKAKFKLNNINADGIGYFPSIEFTDCIARQKNGYVIGVNGEIYKCYEDIGKKEKEIGNVNRKGVNDRLLTTYLIGADKMSNKECNECKLLPVCSGGCPYIRILNEKNKLKNDENCILMKGFEKDFLLAHIKKINL